MKHDICAIVVVYQPDMSLLKDVLKVISHQFSQVMIIDNGSDVDLNNICKNTEWHKLGINKGIAHAHNYGVALARSAGFKYVCLFDQDSIIKHDFLEKISLAYSTLIQLPLQVGAIGPRAVSRSTGEKYTGKFDQGVTVEGGYTRVGQLISSGSFFSIATFDRFGGFNESLFIDLVDFEWCWRLGKQGITHYIIEDVLVEHMFGKQEVRLLGFRITAPTAFCIFYQFRNFMWLLTKNYVPLYWKLSNGFKLTVKFFLLPIWFRDINYLKNSIKGLFHGIFKRKAFRA